MILAALLAACADPEPTPRGTSIEPPATATPDDDPTQRSTSRPTPTASPTATPTSTAAPGTYLALGDSLAVGVGASRPSETGYVGLLADALSGADAVPPVASLRNMAVSGETSASMIDRGQLERAIAVIADADPQVSLVTLDIGGNDLLALLRTSECSGDPQGEPCLRMLAATLIEFEANYRLIVGQLVEALEQHAPDARLAVMTYFNPFSGTAAPYEAAGELALIGTDERVDCDATEGDARGMNDIIVCVGRELGALPVDIQPAFEGLGLQLTHIGAEDIHANDVGYRVIADQFVRVLAEAG